MLITLLSNEEALMGANICADGNTLVPFSPPTEAVKNIKAVEEEMVFACIPGRRSWEEVFRHVFAEAFPEEALHMEHMVRVSVRRMKEGCLPVCVMDKFREQEAFHRRCLAK